MPSIDHTMTSSTLPEVALVIKKQWCQEIFEGTKIWEIRGNSTTRRGTIAVAQAGSKQIIGQVDILDCLCVGRREGDQIVPWDGTHVAHMNFIGANANSTKHCIQDIHATIKYPKIFAWVLGNKCLYTTPKPYNHPKGCIQWIKLTPRKTANQAHNGFVSIQPPKLEAWTILNL